MHYFNIHTHHVSIADDSKSILSLSAGHDDLALSDDHFVAVGIHPWFVNIDTLAEDLQQVKAFAQKTNVKMVGECGLDKLKGLPLAQQIEIFEAQLEIAKEVKKPLLIHCVKAYDQLIASYKNVDPGVALVIHGFNKNPELGKQLLAQGYMLSFGKSILHHDTALASLITETDDFFLETDDEEIDIKEIYQAAADLKNISLDELKELIFANWKKLNLI